MQVLSLFLTQIFLPRHITASMVETSHQRCLYLLLWEIIHYSLRITTRAHLVAQATHIRLRYLQELIIMQMEMEMVMARVRQQVPALNLSVMF